MSWDGDRLRLESRRYHLWPHGTRVLDLGDNDHAAAHLRDLAAHGYALRAVRLRGAGPVDIVAYYDGEHQSGLTQGQRDLVRAWVRRYVASTRGALPVAADDAPFWTSYVTQPAAPPASGARVTPDRGGRAERAWWLVLALLPAALALAFVGFGVGTGGAPGGSVLVSAAAVLALISALITWRHAGGSGPRTPARREVSRVAGPGRARRAGGSFTSTPRA